MPKPNNNKKNKDEEVKIKSGHSSLGEFVKRALPKEEEAEIFEKYAEEEAKDGDIEDSLSEIYQDGSGRMVDVKKLDIKRRRGPIFRFFTFLFTAALLGALSYIIFTAYQNRVASSGGVNFSIQGNEKVAAGEEFFYTVDYKNLGDVGIGNIEIKLNYPENFIFLDASPAAATENNLWKIEALETREGGQIKIKGKIIGEENKRNIIAGVMSYVPNNFSSEFKKEAAFENAVTIAGPEINIEAEGSVLLNQENEIKIKYKTRENNYLKNFRVSLVAPDNIKIIRAKGEEGELNHWQVSEISDEEKELAIKFKAIEKINPAEELVLTFEYSEGDEHYYKFFEKKLNFEIVKNDLNLNLIVNGARSDQGADFGQTLNYSIVYENKGEVPMENVIIMAVLKSDILDWNSLSDKQNGKKGEDSLSWSKEEISGLESLAPGGKGVIDFSINLLPSENAEIEPGKKYEVESYAQFSIANKEFKENEDTKSNTLIIKINSDLSLSEQVRYFSDDNIAVGSGPLPPKVGQTTSYKVYWALTNNLHELNNVKIEIKLPDYVSFDNKSRATVGSLNYDNNERKVIWNIGRMPISVYKAEAEFNITITPSESDVDKILVLIPGSSVEATDAETNEVISKQGKAKTTRLEDDNIAETDGRIVK
jgi:uncharacterized repeat protein (TIGR01451 family)